MSRWEQIKEWLLQSRTFEKSETPERDLLQARVLIFIFYSALSFGFVYTLARLIFSGRVEVIQQLYKVDVLEAPSVAICPFFATLAIVKPNQPMSEWITIKKVEIDGIKNITAKPYVCQYDRECICVRLYDQVLKDHTGEAAKHMGAEATKSKNENIFRERITLSTSLTDSSAEQTLKIGLFDSIDPAPNWYYSRQGEYSMAQLELQVWAVTDFSIMGVQRTVDGDITAMAKSRHLFRTLLAQVGSRGAARDWNSTIIAYEMKNFFVDETISSENAISVYTLGFLFFLVAVRSVAIDAFMSAFFPMWEEDPDSPKFRTFSNLAFFSATPVTCCCLANRKHQLDVEADAGEAKPLLQQGRA